MRLTKEQLRLVNSNARITIGKACPGSGKTTTLIERTKRYKDDPILITTFTTKGKGEILNRLDNPNHEVLTLHGFAYQIIQKNWEKLGDMLGSPSWPESFNLWTSDKEEAGLRDMYPQTYKEVLSALNKLRRTNIEPYQMDMIEDSGLFVTKFRKYRVENMIEYEQRRISHGFINYHDFIPLAKRLVADADISRATYGKYHAVMVDEAQDISAVHWTILEPFMLYQHDMFLIGDTNQTIFGYTGGNGRIFKRLCDRPDSEEYSLSYNFRCAPEIVSVANKVIEDSDMVSLRKFSASVESYLCGSIEEEADALKEHLKPGATVLARTTKYVDRLRELLPGFQVMTIHKSKGKEWDHVGIAGCHEGLIPFAFNLDDDSEERNLFYVACSRAKNKLVFTMTEKPGLYIRQLEYQGEIKTQEHETGVQI